MQLHRTHLAVLFLAVAGSPAGLRAQTPDSTALNKAAIEWVNLLNDAHFDSAAARVDPAAAAQLGAGKLEEIWTSVGGQLGALQSLDPGSVLESQGYHVVDLVGTFANGVVTVRVTLDAESRVSGLFFRPRTEEPT